MNRRRNAIGAEESVGELEEGVSPVVEAFIERVTEGVKGCGKEVQRVEEAVGIVGAAS